MKVSNFYIKDLDNISVLYKIANKINEVIGGKVSVSLITESISIKHLNMIDDEGIIKLIKEYGYDASSCSYRDFFINKKLRCLNHSRKKMIEVVLLMLNCFLLILPLFWPYNYQMLKTCFFVLGLNWFIIILNSFSDLLHLKNNNRKIWNYEFFLKILVALYFIGVVTRFWLEASIYTEINYNDYFIKVEFITIILLIVRLFIKVLNRYAYQLLDRIDEKIKNLDETFLKKGQNIVELAYEKLYHQSLNLPKNLKNIILINKISYYFLLIVFGVSFILIDNFLSENSLTMIIGILLISYPSFNYNNVLIKFLLFNYEALKNGCLIENKNLVDSVEKNKTIILDKTGTLTQGQAQFYKVFSNDMPKIELIKIMSLMEEKVENSTFKQITKFLEGRKNNNYKDFKFHYRPGLGVEAKIAGETYYSGQEPFMRKLGIDLAEYKNDYEFYANKGYLINLLANEKKVLGFIVFDDALNDDALSVVSFLRKKAKVCLMTNSLALSTNNLKDRLCLDDYYFEATNKDKKDIVRSLYVKDRYCYLIKDQAKDDKAIGPCKCLFNYTNEVDLNLKSDVYILNYDLKSIPKIISKARCLSKISIVDLAITLGAYVSCFIIYVLFLLEHILYYHFYFIFIIICFLLTFVKLSTALVLLKEKKIIKRKYKIKVSRMMSKYCVMRLEKCFLNNDLEQFKINLKKSSIIVKVDDNEMLQDYVDIINDEGYKLLRIK